MNSLHSYKKLLFPLNIYATLIHLEGITPGWLHFGIFQNQNEPVHRAQKRASEILLAQIPSPARNIKLLEVGSGLGTTLNHLLNQGYQATGLNPDSSQVNLARTRFGLSNQQLQECSFEDFQAEQETFATIVFQESAQYVNPINLLYKSVSLLADTGKLIIMDEFRVKCNKREEGRLPELANFLTLTQRAGFIVDKNIDLTSQAQPTIPWLLDKLQKHRATIKRQLTIREEQITRLENELNLYNQYYKNNIFSYNLLVLSKNKKTRYQLKLASPQDKNKIKELFVTVFEQKLSDKTYDWKYGKNKGQAVIAMAGQRVVAHYGGISRRIMFLGKEDIGVQIADVMVHPEHRTARGPFFLTASTFIEQFIGNCSPYLIPFGFPNRRAMRLGLSLKLYDKVEELVEGSITSDKSDWPILKTRLRVRSQHWLENNRTKINQLWQKMAEDAKEKIIGIRDSSYLIYRYCQCPDRDFEIFSIHSRLSGSLRGILILKEKEGSLFIVDMICGYRDIPILLAHSRKLCHRANHGDVRVWLTRNMLNLPGFSLLTTTSLSIEIPINITSNGPQKSETKNRWWLMAGDTDFI